MIVSAVSLYSALSLTLATGGMFLTLGLIAWAFSQKTKKK